MKRRFSKYVCFTLENQHGLKDVVILIREVHSLHTCINNGHTINGVTPSLSTSDYNSNKLDNPHVIICGVKRCFLDWDTCLMHLMHMFMVLKHSIPPHFLRIMSPAPG